MARRPGLQAWSIGLSEDAANIVNGDLVRRVGP
jgi:hypothetical protein